LFDFPEGGLNGKKSGVEDKKKAQQHNVGWRLSARVSKTLYGGWRGGKKFSFCLLFPSLPPILGGRGGLYVKLRFRASLCLIICVKVRSMCFSCQK